MPQVAGAATNVVLAFIRIVDADAKTYGVLTVFQAFDLVQPLQNRINSVGQYQARQQSGRVTQYIDEPLDNERFAAGE